MSAKDIFHNAVRSALDNKELIRVNWLGQPIARLNKLLETSTV